LDRINPGVHAYGSYTYKKSYIYLEGRGDIKAGMDNIAEVRRKRFAIRIMRKNITKLARGDFNFPRNHLAFHTAAGGGAEVRISSLFLPISQSKPPSLPASHPELPHRTLSRWVSRGTFSARRVYII
jgi:hypothetical protein